MREMLLLLEVKFKTPCILDKDEAEIVQSSTSLHRLKLGPEPLQEDGSKSSQEKKAEI